VVIVSFIGGGNWQTVSHNVEVRTHNISGNRHWLHM